MFRGPYVGYVLAKCRFKSMHRRLIKKIQFSVCIRGHGLNYQNNMRETFYEYFR